ncbi:MAG: DUF6445 family protein [Sphingomicrobium sp.]
MKQTRAAAADGLFSIRSQVDVDFQMLGGSVPVLTIDGIYHDPAAVRRRALELDYVVPPYPYPGRIAEYDQSDFGIAELVRKMLHLVNSAYLPRVPPIQIGDRAIGSFDKLHTDFAIVDVHPDQLRDLQREPHIDNVPVFGLIYLNEAERGGTMFFRRKGASQSAPQLGYVGPLDKDWHFLGRIEGKYNRLAIYPGFIPHSGEIEGDWIKGDDRFTQPRLTQRLVFTP